MNNSYGGVGKQRISWDYAYTVILYVRPGDTTAPLLEFSAEKRIGLRLWVYHGATQIMFATADADIGDPDLARFPIGQENWNFVAITVDGETVRYAVTPT